jgi:hypothetical protein
MTPTIIQKSMPRPAPLRLGARPWRFFEARPFEIGGRDRDAPLYGRGCRLPGDRVT